MNDIFEQLPADSNDFYYYSLCSMAGHWYIKNTRFKPSNRIYKHRVRRIGESESNFTICEWTVQIDSLNYTIAFDLALYKMKYKTISDSAGVIRDEELYFNSVDEMLNRFEHFLSILV